MRAIATATACACMLAAIPARAALVSYGFGCITPQSNADLVAACTAGQSQLFVDVSDTMNGQVLNRQVLFTFRNRAGGTHSSVTDVHFDDGTLLGIARVIDSPGVAFSEGASPPNLPGGNNISPPFRTTQGFLADSDPPVSGNGVNPGEWLGILFDLQPNNTYSSVLNALSLAGAPGGLRIGAHVQAFSAYGGANASFVNTPIPVTAVPLPAAAWLFGGGLVGLLTGLRRRR